MKNQLAADPGLDDESLLFEAIAGGDAHAMRELMRGQGRWVRGIILAAGVPTGDVEDVLQNIWLSVWRQARRLEDASRWRGWLCSIARNAALDYLRRRSRRRRGLLGWLRFHGSRNLEEAGDDRPAEDGRDEQRLVLEAIRSLPAIYREPFVLRHLEDWSYREIGRTLGLPVDTVETRLVRARRLLRARLEGRLSGNA